MVPFKFEHTIDKVLRTGPSVERTLLKIYTGTNFSESDAKQCCGFVI